MDPRNDSRAISNKIREKKIRRKNVNNRENSPTVQKK
jgi:hypothetical protein